MHDLIIFDCDGVLVDSEMIAGRVLAECLAPYGLDFNQEGCRDRFTGLSFPAVIAAVEAELGSALPADFEDRVRARDRAAFETELTAIAGIQDALDAISVPVCVASSGSLEKIRHSLTLTALISRFDPHLFSARQVARSKPAPDLFLFAAEKMGVEPARCLVIEDSVNGVKAARAAGMAVLGFTGGSHWLGEDDAPLRAAGADRVFSHMRDLPGLVSQGY